MVLQAHRNRCWHNVVVDRIGSCLPFHSNTLLQCLTLDVHFRPSRPFVIMWSVAHGKQPTLAVLSTTRLYAMRGPYVIFHDRTSYCHLTHTISSVIRSPNSYSRGRLHLHRSLLCFILHNQTDLPLSYWFCYTFLFLRTFAVQSCLTLILFHLT